MRLHALGGAVEQSDVLALSETDQRRLVARARQDHAAGARVLWTRRQQMVRLVVALQKGAMVGQVTIDLVKGFEVARKQHKHAANGSRERTRALALVSNPA